MLFNSVLQGHGHPSQVGLGGVIDVEVDGSEAASALAVSKSPMASVLAVQFALQSGACAAVSTDKSAIAIRLQTADPDVERVLLVSGFRRHCSDPLIYGYGIPDVVIGSLYIDRDSNEIYVVINSVLKDGAL